MKEETEINLERVPQELNVLSLGCGTIYGTTGSDEINLLMKCMEEDPRIRLDPETKKLIRIESRREITTNIPLLNELLMGKAIKSPLSIDTNPIELNLLTNDTNGNIRLNLTLFGLDNESNLQCKGDTIAQARDAYNSKKYQIRSICDICVRRTLGIDDDRKNTHLTSLWKIERASDLIEIARNGYITLR